MILRGNKYDGSIDKYPIKAGEVWSLENGSCVSVGDLTKGVHEFMTNADCVFIDPPCNKGNLKSFYTKADVPYFDGDYTEFLNLICTAIDKIAPKIIFVETFKTNKEMVAEILKKRYQFVRTYESTYYHSKKNKCRIIQATNEDVDYGLNGLDEWDAVFKICEVVPFKCIGDFVMGQGLVAQAAFKHGKKFVGQELNANRLAVCVSRIAKAGGVWKVNEQHKD